MEVLGRHCWGAAGTRLGQHQDPWSVDAEEPSQFVEDCVEVGFLSAPEEEHVNVAFRSRVPEVSKTGRRS